MSTLRKPILLAAAAVAALLACPALASANNGKSPPRSREYETERAGMKIALFEKSHAAFEKDWKQNGKVVLLVHGATWSSKCTFDPVEGYSLMDAFADAGCDVWAVDLHGYGRSGKTNRDWSEASNVAADIDAAVDYIRALRWVERVHVFGYQWGAQSAALFAQQKPNKVARLALLGMRYQQFEKKKSAPQTQYRTNSNATAMLKPDDGDLDPEFVRRRAQICLQNDPKSPNGAILDMEQPSPADPAQIRTPTLLVMGERDTDAYELNDRIEFFKALGSRTKSFTVLSGLGKYATFEKNRRKIEQALINFFDQ